MVDAYLADMEKEDNLVLEHDEQASMIEEYLNGDKSDIPLRDKILSCNLRYVIYVAKRYTSYGLPFADLIQEGNVGLIEALDKFDMDISKQSGGTFLTYAYYHIVKSIMRYIESNNRIVRISKSNEHQKVFHNLVKYDSKGMTKQQLIDKICVDLGVSRKSVNNIMDYMAATDVTTYQMESGDDADIYDIIADENNDDFDADLIREGETLILTTAISQLEKSERFIVRSRWLSEPKLSLKQTGDALGITGERVRQREVKVLKKLKAILQQMKIED
jgi:RNA polymerase sigma factor (sigma-70 family)